MPTFSLIYTSVRAPLIQSVIEEWLKKADKPNDLEIILTVDANDKASQEVAASLVGKVPNFQWFIQASEPFNCVKGWNLAAAKSTGKVLVQVTDDMVPPGAWDSNLEVCAPKGWMDKEAAVHVEDGYVHDIMVLAIITRARYERFGYFFYPDYESLFCDTELTEVAYRDGVVINAKHLLFEHRHPDCQKRTRDAVDLVHASKERWARGETIFYYRRSKGFPVDAGPKATEADKHITPEPIKFCVYIQATRDDFCLREVCDRMLEEGVNDFFFSVPDEYWSGRPTRPEEISQVRIVASQIKALGANVEVMVHKVKTYRFSGDTRLRVETRVRNDAMSYIRRKGWEHVLIMDGDELWRRGTVNFVRRLVVEWHPTSINCRMVPVIGLPGYPIDGATDVAVIYINSKVPFQECRTPIGDQFRVQMPLVIHFTGTRRTMEEIIIKHTDSGHFDDPDYDFQTWLDKVLPNIRPGFQYTWPNGIKGLHMYTKYQIWPAVRHWMDDELAEMPKSIHRYLGGYETEIPIPELASKNAAIPESEKAQGQAVQGTDFGLLPGGQNSSTNS